MIKEYGNDVTYRTILKTTCYKFLAQLFLLKCVHILVDIKKEKQMYAILRTEREKGKEWCM